MTYNLARLQLAERYGFWNNEYYNSERQYSFVWGFDAIHWPFIKIGFAYGLPSLTCFLGTLWITYKILAQTHGKRIAWLALLGLCSLPTLVQQGISTKNDIPLVFGTACYIYAIWRHHITNKPNHLLWAAVAIGFMAGAKGTGLVFGFILGLYGIWYLRKNLPALRFFCLACTASMIMLGSLESYLNNKLRGDDWLGDTSFIKPHQNADGALGTAANLIRYHFSVLDLGADVFCEESPTRPYLEQSCRAILNFTGLKDKGIHPLQPDNNLALYRDKQETTWTFGPLGFIALCGACVILFTRPIKSTEWGLAAGGMTALIAICSTVSWMPWNNRFLLVPLALFTVSLGIVAGRPRNNPAIARLFVAIGLFTIIAYSWEANPRTPKNLTKTITKRTWFMTQERPEMLEILRYLRREKDKYPGGIWIAAGGDSWIFPIFNMTPGDYFHSLPHPTPETLASLFSGNAGKGRALLTLNRGDLTEASLPTLRQIKLFNNHTALFAPAPQP